MKSIVVLSCVSLAFAAVAAGPQAVLTDPLEWLYPDSRVETARPLAETDVPANGVAEANVLLNGLKAGEPVRYTCCYPGGKWMNRLLDNEVLRPVLLPWGCQLFGLDGYLHWGYNQFDRTNDPLRVGIAEDAHIDVRLPPGDRNIVYAGPDGPWPSVRLEAMRQGFEDLELLKSLARRNRALSDRLVSSIVRGFGDYTLDPGAYRSVRRELLSACGQP